MQTELWAPRKKLHRPTQREVRAIERRQAAPWSQGSMDQGDSWIFAPSFPFLPTGLPNLFLWLRPDMGMSTSGGNVVSWTDQSANAYSFSPTSTVTFNTSDAKLGGQPSITGSGSAWLKSSVTVTHALPFTYYSVFYSTSPSTSPQIILSNGGVEPQIYLLSGKYAAYDTFPVSGGTTDTNPHIMCAVFDATLGVAIYVDSSASTIATSGVAGYGMSSYLGVGYGGGALTGAWGENIIYAASHLPAQITKVFSYAGARYSQSWL